MKGIALQIDLDETVSSGAFAKLVGVSRQRVDQLIVAGVLARDATARAWLLAYAKNLRTLADGGADPELASHRRRMAKARATTAELDLRQREGELIDCLATAEFVVDLVLRLRQSVRNLPPVMVIATRGLPHDQACYAADSVLQLALEDVTVQLALANCAPPLALALEIAKLRRPFPPTSRLEPGDPGYRNWKWANDVAVAAEQEIAKLEAVVKKQRRERETPS